MFCLWLKGVSNSVRARKSHKNELSKFRRYTRYDSEKRGDRMTDSWGAEYIPLKKKEKPDIDILIEAKMGELWRMTEFLKGRDDEALDLALTLFNGMLEGLCKRADKK